MFLGSFMLFAFDTKLTSIWVHSFALRFWISPNRVVGLSLSYGFVENDNIGCKEIGLFPQSCGAGHGVTSLLRICCISIIVLYFTISVLSIEHFIEHNF